MKPPFKNETYRKFICEDWVESSTLFFPHLLYFDLNGELKYIPGITISYVGCYSTLMYLRPTAKSKWQLWQTIHPIMQCTLSVCLAFLRLKKAKFERFESERKFVQRQRLYLCVVYKHWFVEDIHVQMTLY